MSHAHPHWRNFAPDSLRVRILALSAKARASLWKLGIGRIGGRALWGWRLYRVARAQKRDRHHSEQHAETGTRYEKFGHERLLPVSRHASGAFGLAILVPDVEAVCPLVLATSTHLSFAIRQASRGFPM